MKTNMEKAEKAVASLGWTAVLIDLPNDLAICRRGHDPVRDTPLDISYSTNRLMAMPEGGYCLVSGVYDLTFGGAQESYLERLAPSW